MALLKPILGAGHILGSFVFGGVKTYVGDAEIIPPLNSILQFYSQSDYFVGDIRLDHSNSNYLKVKATEEKVGGLKGFNFEIDKLPDFSFFNLMKVRIILNGVHWYTGELLLSEEPDTRDPVKQFSGRGYVKYFSDIDNITETYENKTLKEILEDQIFNNIISITPIKYDPDLIAPPDITITKMEISSKSVKKIFDNILDIANKNYDTAQYTYGVNKDLFVYFREIERTVKNNYFEGYQFQDPKVKVNDSKVINSIELFRAKENNTDELETIGIIEDSESISRYGLRKSKITSNEYIDNTTTVNIANSKLKKFKDALTEISVKDMELDDPIEIGFYNISNRIQEYKKLVNDCENLSDWTISTGTSSISLDSLNYISGKNSFKWESPGNATGDNIEIELDDPIMYPLTLRAYFKQDVVGEKINLTAYDEDGNEITAGEMEYFNILTEDGGFLLAENGDFIVQEDTNQLGIDIKIIEDWFLFKFDISTISNLKKINFYILNNDAFVLNIDRIEVISKSFFTRLLTLDKAEYELNRNGITFSGVFGEKIDTVLDDIKKLEEDDQNILGLFQK